VNRRRDWNGKRHEMAGLVNFVPPIIGQRRIAAAAAKTGKNPVPEKQRGVLHG
jgi:hypothetical protein